MNWNQVELKVNNEQFYKFIKTNAWLNANAIDSFVFKLEFYNKK